MCNLLVLDTSTHTCSVGVLYKNEIFTQSVDASGRHAMELLPMIEQVMNKAGMLRSHLSAIGVVVGPGSFIGVRTAICTAQALAFALSIPVIALSSLAVLAQTAYLKLKQERVIASWDARMNAFYWGAYAFDNGVMRVVGKDTLSPCAEHISMPWKDAVKVGNAWKTYELTNQYSGPFVHDLYLMPEGMLELAKSEYTLGHVMGVEQLEPVYLRDKVAKTLQERAGS